MQRRNFILGLGTATAGGSALLGSGAFTSVSADRDISVNVAGDNSAFLRMTPVVHKIEESDPATVYENDGQLTVDVTQGGAQGVNVNALTWIGTPNFRDQSSWVDEDDDNIEWIDDHRYTPRAAFGIENRGTQEYELTFEYEFAGNPGDSTIEFHIYDGAAPEFDDDFPRVYEPSLTGTEPATVPAGDGDGSFGLGKRIFASIKIDTTEGSVDDDLSGTLTITAEVAD